MTLARLVLTPDPRLLTGITQSVWSGRWTVKLSPLHNWVWLGTELIRRIAPRYCHVDLLFVTYDQIRHDQVSFVADD